MNINTDDLHAILSNPDIADIIHAGRNMTRARPDNRGKDMFTMLAAIKRLKDKNMSQAQEGTQNVTQRITFKYRHSL